MKKILNALFLTIITLVTFSCSDVPAPYDINGGGNGEGPALTGDGTKENPYDIASAMTKQDNSEAWVMRLQEMYSSTASRRIRCSYCFEFER